MSEKLETSLILRDNFTDKLTRIDDALRSTESSMDKFAKATGQAPEAFDDMKRSADVAEDSLNSVEQTTESLASQIDASSDSFSQVEDDINRTTQAMDRVAEGASATTQSFQRVGSGVRTISQTFSNFRDRLTQTFDSFRRLGDIASSAISRLNSKVQNGTSKMFNSFRSGAEKIVSLFGSFGNRISRRFNLQGVFGKMRSSLSSFTSSITNTFSNAFSGIQSKFSSLGSRMGNAFNGIKGRLRGVGASISESFGSAFRSVGTRFEGFQTRIINGFRNIKNAAKGIGNALSNFGGNMRNAFSNLLGTGNRLTGMFTSMFSALSIFNLVSVGVNQITQSMDGAISRFDQLNQFPRMMEMWGYSAEEAQSATDRLVEGIEGLPTTLDGMTSSVQDFVVAGMDLDTAVDAALAFNDALLMNGTNAAEASAAMTQLNQMIAVGKVDQMGWNSLVRGAGKAIDEVSKSLLGADANQSDLYNGLQSGSVTMDEFIDKMIEMDQATGGFAEQALSGSEGIRTSMSNLRTALSRNLADIIDAFDEALVNQGFDNIAQSLDGFKTVIDDVFGSIADSVPGFVDTTLNNLEKLWAGFEDTGAPDALAEAFDSVGDALKNVFENLDYQAIGQAVGNVVEFFADITTSIGDFVSEIDSDQFEQITDVALKFVAGMAAVKVGGKVVGFIRDIGSAFGGLARDLGKVSGLFGKSGSVGTAGQSLGEAMGGGQMAPAFDFKNTFGNVIANFTRRAGNLAIVFGVIKLIEQLAEAMKQVNDKVSGNLAELAPKMANMAIGLAGMGLAVKAADRLTRTNKRGAVEGLLLVAGISANLMIAAEAMDQVNSKVTGDISSFAPKMANMAIAIGGLGLVTAVAGTFASKNPMGALVGLGFVAGVSLELMLAAEAMQQVNDKVTDDISSFSNKMANMAIAIGSMSLIVGAVGALVSTGIGAVIAAGGLVTVALLALELMLVAEALQQFDEKVPDDMSGVTNKIDVMAQTFQHFNQADFGGILDVFQNALGSLNISLVISTIEQYARLGEALQEFNQVEIPDVSGKIEQIQNAIQKLDKSTIGGTLENLVTAADLTIVNSSVQSLLGVAGTLSELQNIEINQEAVTSTIDTINQVIGKLGGNILLDALNNLVDAATISTAQLSIQAMVNITTPINQLGASGEETNFEGAKSAIDDIRNVVQKISQGSLGELFGSVVELGMITTAQNSISRMVDMIQPINALGNAEINIDGALSNIDGIKRVINAISNTTWEEIFTSLVGPADLTSAVEALNQMNSIAGSVNLLGNREINIGGAIVNIEGVKRVINQLNTLPELTGDASGLEGMISSFERLTGQINQFASQSSVNIESVISAFSRLSASSTATTSTVSANFSTMTTLSKNSMSQITSTIRSGMNASNSAVQSGMSLLNSSVSSGMSIAANTARSGSSQIVNAFSGLRGQLYSAGIQSMSGLTSGIHAGAGQAYAAARSVANRVATTVRSALEIRSPSRIMEFIGQFIPAGLAEGILGASNLVERAANSMAEAAIPNISNVGTITQRVNTVMVGDNPSDYGVGSHNARVNVDSEDIERLRMNADQSIVIENRQLSPQVTVNVENNGDRESIDENDIAEKVAQVIVETVNSDLG